MTAATPGDQRSTFRPRRDQKLTIAQEARVYHSRHDRQPAKIAALDAGADLGEEDEAEVETKGRAGLDWDMGDMDGDGDGDGVVHGGELQGGDEGMQTEAEMEVETEAEVEPESEQDQERSQDEEAVETAISDDNSDDEDVQGDRRITRHHTKPSQPQARNSAPITCRANSDEQSEEEDLRPTKKPRRHRRTRKEMEEEEQHLAGDEGEGRPKQAARIRVLRSVQVERQAAVKAAYIRVQAYTACKNPFPSPEEEVEIVDKAWEWLRRTYEKFADCVLLSAERPVVSALLSLLPTALT